MSNTNEEPEKSIQVKGPSTRKWLGVTSEDNWKQCVKHGLWGADDIRLSQLKKVRTGDYLAVYLKKMKMAGICEVTGEYFYDKTKVWQDGIYPHRISITKYKVPNQPIDIKKLYDEAIKPKLLAKGDNRGTPGGYFGQAIRPLPEDEFSIYESEIDKHIDSQEEFGVFLTGYPEKNLVISKQRQILGWKRNPTTLSIGDRVFVYNTDKKKLECGFKIRSNSNRVEPVWEDELDSNPPQQKYKFRWDAEVICDNLDIDYNTIKEIEPFKSGRQGKKANFHILVVSDSANSIRNPIYKPFRDYLLNKCETNRLANNHDVVRDWSFDVDEAIDEILSQDTENELAIDRQIVKRILFHLKAGKHVILVGPPGVGKTDLARRILKIIGKKVIGNDSFLESVASDEWSRYEVIGGVDLHNNFQEGYITKAVVDRRWLLIDEFNRANMNKAFGEMFLAIEYHEIKLRPSEVEIYRKDIIEIPQSFRMICTMNDFDKNLLLTELSYGLINRFAFVSITPELKREPTVVYRRVKSILGQDDDTSYESCRKQIDIYFDFINDVRKYRNIGVRTSIDVIKYLVAASQDQRNINKYIDDDTDDAYKWKSLNDALCDYVLPQFDRLDRKTIDNVLTYAESHLKDKPFEPFRTELKNASERLKEAVGWLANKDVP